MVFVARSSLGVLQIGEPDGPKSGGVDGSPSSGWRAGVSVVKVCQTMRPSAGSSSASEPQKVQHG